MNVSDWFSTTEHSTLLLGGAVLLLVVPLLWHLVRMSQRNLGRLHRRIELLESEKEVATWSATGTVWVYDLDTDHIHTSVRNPSAPKVTMDSSELTGAAWRELTHRDDRERMNEVIASTRSGLIDHFDLTFRQDYPDGSQRKIHTRGAVSKRSKEDGRAQIITGISVDITDTAELDRQRRIMTAVLESMSEAVVIKSESYQFISVNEAFERMTGYTQENIEHQDTSVLFSHHHSPEFHRRRRATMQRYGIWQGELWLAQKDGHPFLSWCETRSVLDKQSGERYYVTVINDITEARRNQQQLTEMANYDALTGLPNRGQILQRLQQAINRAKQEEGLFAVMMLDLDRFKQINDSLGHHMGDHMLQRIAARLNQVASLEATPGRLGGDEFVVIQDNVTHPKKATDYAEKLIAKVSKPLLMDAHTVISTSTSVGIAFYPEHGDTPEALLNAADMALYEAKADGKRAEYAIFKPDMELQEQERKELTRQLRHAAERDELHLVFQPQLDIDAKKLMGVEALLRWQHPERGEISPFRFIPMAEENGMMSELGLWVLNQACQALRRWRNAGFFQVQLSINVSIIQLLSGDLPARIKNILDVYNLPPEALCLEFNQQHLMKRINDVQDEIQKLKDLNVRICVDNFGRGSVVMEHLVKNSVDVIKIDHTLIHEAESNPDTQKLVAGIIAFAHAADIFVLAEGVENVEQLGMIRDFGIDGFQGYLREPPLNEAGLLKRLKMASKHFSDQLLKK